MSMAEESDEALMAAYAQGNTTAFQTLFERYQQKIFGFLSRRLSYVGRQVIEDLFQTVWLKVHVNRAQFDREQKFSTWIFTIAQNSMLDHIKKASTKREMQNETELLNQVEESESSEAVVIRKEDAKRLDSLLGKLPDNLRDVVVLCDIEDFPSKEAAIILGRSDASVRQNLMRGRKRLRELLGHSEKEV